MTPSHLIAPKAIASEYVGNMCNGCEALFIERTLRNARNVNSLALQ